MWRKQVLIAAAFLCHLISNGQPFYELQGRVLGENEKPLAGATLVLLNTLYGAVSDADGKFRFLQVAPGRYALHISAIGYGAATLDIEVPISTPLAISMKRAATQLDAVFVSAQKTEENAQRVPLSLTTLSARQVREFRLWNISEITGIVPNLFSSDPGDQRNVTAVRGIVSTSYDPAVVTYIDGVNQFGLDTYIAPLLDIERIEVLRGPQGTLYGRNAMGGVINIITRQPSYKTGGFVSADVGNFKQRRFTAGLNLPVVKDKLLFSAAGMFYGLDGYYRNAFNNTPFDKQTTASGNYSLRLTPGQRWAFGLHLKHNNTRNEGAFSLAPGKDQAFLQPFVVNQNAGAKMIDNTLNSLFLVSYAGRTFNFTSQSSYQSNRRYYDRPLDADFSPFDGFTIINNYGDHWNKVKVYTQEFRFTSPAATASSLQWTAGAYLFHNENPVRQGTHFGDPMITGAPDQNFTIINTNIGKSSGAAVFGQGNYRLTPKLHVIAGLRYDYERKKQNVSADYQRDGSTTPDFAIRTDTGSAASFSALSPKAGLQFVLNDRQQAWATYSRGYRSGGITQLSADPSAPPLYPYDPEYSNNIEVGIKNTLLDQRLQLNATVFYTQVNDAQVPTLVLPDAITITRNAGKLQSKGFELECAATPARGLEVNWHFGYTDATYETLRLAQYGQEVDLAGKKQLFTPDITSMVMLQYGIPVSRSGNLKLIARTEWQYFGRQYFDLSNTIMQSPYNLYHARAGFAAPFGEVMLWGRNLFDQRYVDYGYDFGAVHLGNPRAWGVTVTARF